MGTLAGILSIKSILINVEENLSKSMIGIQRKNLILSGLAGKNIV